MELSIWIGIFSTVIAVLAFLVSYIQLLVTFRPNVFMRIHNFCDRTVLEIVNAGTLVAEDVVVKVCKDDIDVIVNSVSSPVIKERVRDLLELKSHCIQLFPSEVRCFVLYMQNDRPSFSNRIILLRGEISYKTIFFFRKKKKVEIEIGGIGSMVYEEWLSPSK